MNKRRDVVKAARSWIGTKWRHRGRSKFGIDCVGLVYLSRIEAGLPIEDQKGYGREPWNDKLRQELRRQFGEPISESEWDYGDVVLFAVGDKAPRHIGILADYKYGGFSLIHSHNFNNTCEIPLNNETELDLIEVYSCHQ